MEEGTSEDENTGVGVSADFGANGNAELTNVGLPGQPVPDEPPTEEEPGPEPTPPPPPYDGPPPDPIYPDEGVN